MVVGGYSIATKRYHIYIDSNLKPVQCGTLDIVLVYYVRIFDSTNQQIYAWRAQHKPCIGYDDNNRVFGPPGIDFNIDKIVPHPLDRRPFRSMLPPGVPPRRIIHPHTDEKRRLNRAICVEMCLGRFSTHAVVAV